MNFTVNGAQVDLLGEAIQISNLEQIQPGDQVSELFFKFFVKILLFCTLEQERYKNGGQWSDLGIANTDC